jgi:hypothetical protein
MTPPIDTLHLFPRLNKMLTDFLRALPEEDWHKPTVARQWRVKDVAAHLLDGNFRRIALHRDGWAVRPGVPINSYSDLVQYLNMLNADWIKAAKRLSPQILIELLEQTNEEVYRLFSALDPFAEAMWAVSWAGELKSYNWFDLAREYTERWLHQQQIRDAMGNEELLNKEFYHPFLTVFLQGWPHTCADLRAEDGTLLKTTITGEGGGDWFLLQSNGQWKLSETGGQPVAETTINGSLAWKLFSKSIRKEDLDGGVAIKGDRQLGERILDMVSVMA